KSAPLAAPCGPRHGLSKYVDEFGQFAETSMAVRHYEHVDEDRSRRQLSTSGVAASASAASHASASGSVRHATCLPSPLTSRNRSPFRGLASGFNTHAASWGSRSL